MKKNKSINSTIIACTILLLTLVFVGCNKDNTDVLPTISQTVIGLEDLSQLEFATVKADLVVALSNKNNATGAGGSFTVFAPTNQAFAKIGLVNPQDFNALQTPFLVSMLNYHISNGSTKENLLTSGANILSLLGTTVTKRIIVKPNGDKYVNGSKIIVTNTQADNGIVYVINRVLLASGTDIANTAIFFSQGKGFVKPELSFLAEALVYCDLMTTLSDKTANYTVFAPTDQAFKDFGQTLGITLNRSADIRKLDKATLTEVLLTHVLNNGGKFTSELYAGSIPALNGKSIALGAYANGLLTVKAAGNVTPANMVIPDIQTTNGVVHVIDKVLLP